MFALDVVAKDMVCTKLLLVLGCFIIRSEQQIPQGTCHGPLITATYKELRTIAGEIWKADTHRLDVDAVVNNGGEKFFKDVDVESFPETYKKMIVLFNNYDAFKGRVVPFGPDHIKRENDFLDAIIKTGPIEKARLWLHKKGLLSASNDTEFKKELHKYWFTVYDRRGVLSSGFGHTFAGEIYFIEKQDLLIKQVNGLHNWLRMLLEEKAGELTNVKEHYNSNCPHFVKYMEFDWKPSPQPNRPRSIYHKGLSTAFIGASPEVEIAISTICLLVSCPDNECPIRLGLKMKTDPWKEKPLTMWKGKPLTIGSSHPICYK